MYPDTGKPDLRASDADREATAERLHVAAVEGRLDAEELEERLTAAYTAKTCVELTRLTADVTVPAPAPASLPDRPVFVRERSGTNGFAIASLVFALFWFGWFGSVLAIVFGHVALSQIGRTRGRQRGRGLAVAGLLLGYIEVLMFFAVMFGTVAIS